MDTHQKLLDLVGGLASSQNAVNMACILLSSIVIEKMLLQHHPVLALLGPVRALFLIVYLFATMISLRKTLHNLATEKDPEDTGMLIPSLVSP